ncbi:DUF4268 domain-containing protein [Roseovarius sp. A21]|uniref:DUF4268 domain-containing protein n=1 Tax=Roseovarius bejariae TaxID=2576383 RepID=A0A844CZ83_9RHOB|nr:DUF4268 domain-containing protein [Roseovarius bejariae]MRU15334.1 DUF4268 domain-containing protein [Roseovarius bejariae]
MSVLGRLEKVELRDIWKTEAQDFTPWLAGEDNLALLSDTLGIDLELEAVEQNVGPFRADILCKDTLSDRWVLVENQLERTDHTHLGQLMTYAAGLDAVTIVWIASRVADEHRAAMDWLNEITDTEVRFFALEVELWRIGESPAAPKFNVVSKPNDWSRSTTAASKAVAEGELSPTRQLQREYWETVEGLLETGSGPIRPVKPQAASWVGHSIGRTHFSLNMSMNTRENWIRVELYLSGPAAKGNFDMLADQKDQIEQELGRDLDWQRLDEKRDARICVTRNAAALDQKQSWAEEHQWLTEHLIAFHKVFAPRIRGIDPEMAGLVS